MSSVNVLDMQGKKVGTVDLSDSIFGIEPNKAVMHQMVVSFLANQRHGTQSALTRSEVSGGGKKPWRQKAQQERLNGITAVSFLHRSPEVTDSLLTRKSEDLL